MAFNPWSGLIDTMRFQRQRKQYRMDTGDQNPTRERVSEFLRMNAPRQPESMEPEIPQPNQMNMGEMDPNAITEMLRKRAFGKDRDEINRAIRARVLARNMAARQSPEVLP